MISKKIFAVIGDPIKHSLSPVMHNAVFHTLGIPAEYHAIHIPNDSISLANFAQQARQEFAGFNVTAPHKQAIRAFLDKISPISAMTGSVNTVVVSEAGMFGTSTDGTGFQQAVLEAFDYSLKNAKITILGAGGAAKAVAYHALAEGACSITILNRTEESARILCDGLKSHYPSAIIHYGNLNSKNDISTTLEQSELAVQCTSLGLRPNDPMPLPPDLFPAHIKFFEANYRDTRILRALRERGNNVSNGLGMLLYQGVAAFQCWFPNMEPPVKIMRDALLTAIQHQTNS